MKQGKYYLIIEKNNDGKDCGSIREWEVLEEANTAYKLQDKIVPTRGYILFTDKEEIDTPFWKLKSEIDTLGKTKYQILEELNK